MKTTKTNKCPRLNGLMALLLGAALAAPVLAQSASDAAATSGATASPSTQSAAPATAPCPGGQGGRGAGKNTGQGAGQGAGQGMMQPGQKHSQAASLMTPEERAAHKEKMRSVKTYDECTAVQAEQRATMEARAKEKGVTLPSPRQNACERMKTKGAIQ